MKEVYNIIKTLRPHFFSLREINDNVSLDIKIPSNWKYENMLDVDENIPFSVKVQDKKPKNTLVSLISEANSLGYDYVFEYANKVISINIEEEEKQRLFTEKVNELKSLFLNSPLDKLKDISFDEQLSTVKGDGEIQLGSDEGSGADGEDKETTDSRDPVTE
jgi:hypothetical protein